MLVSEPGPLPTLPFVAAALVLVRHSRDRQALRTRSAPSPVCPPACLSACPPCARLVLFHCALLHVPAPPSALPRHRRQLWPLLHCIIEWRTIAGRCPSSGKSLTSHLDVNLVWHSSCGGVGFDFGNIFSIRLRPRIL